VLVDCTRPTLRLDTTFPLYWRYVFYRRLQIFREFYVYATNQSTCGWFHFTVD